MIDLTKYSAKEVFAAIQAVEEIVDCEDFVIDVVEEDGDLCFSLIDRQWAYLGDIGSDRFVSLGGLLDRLDTYHKDYFYNDYEERVEEGEEIPRDDWCRKVLAFFESDYVANLLMAIDVETYQAYKDKTLDAVGLTPQEREVYMMDRHFDSVGYVLDKAIAVAIMNTQSGYPMVEYDNRIFIAALCDWYDSKEGMLADLEVGEESFCNSFTNYGVVVETEQWQVKDDMYDIGLVGDDDEWVFYLSKFELEYVGLGEELKKFKKDFEAVVNDAIDRCATAETNDVKPIDYVKE